MTDQTMGQRIAQQRKKLGISQEALGEKMNVSRQAISKWEADGAVPEIDKLIALSKLFGVSVGWLLGVEEQPEKQADELTETQLKMVEEIVRRYKSEPAEKRSSRSLGIILTAVVAIAAICICVFTPNNADTHDYRQQINNLEANFGSIENQLSILSTRIDSMSSSIEDAASPLSGYRFRLKPNADKNTLLVGVEAIPETRGPDTKATLYVRLNGSQYLSAPFAWDGSAYLAYVEVEYLDGYEYWMVLQSPEGTQESVQLTDATAQYPLRQYAITCEVNVGTSRFDKPSHSLNLSDFEVHLRQPEHNNWGNINWEYAEWVVYHIRGDQRETVHTESLLVGEESFTEMWGPMGNFGFYLPELQEGDGLELWCRAALSNSLEASTLACSWAYVNGELIQSEPVS